MSAGSSLLPDHYAKAMLYACVNIARLQDPNGQLHETSATKTPVNLLRILVNEGAMYVLQKL